MSERNILTRWGRRLSHRNHDHHSGENKHHHHHEQHRTTVSTTENEQTQIVVNVNVGPISAGGCHPPSETTGGTGTPGRPVHTTGTTDGTISNGVWPISNVTGIPSRPPGVWPGPRSSLYLPVLFIRAIAGDTGARPIQGVFWESPDIIVLPGVPPLLAPDSPPTQLGGYAKPNTDNTVYAHVWNLGQAPCWRTLVEFYWFNPTMGFDSKDANLIGHAYVDLDGRGALKTPSRGCHKLVKCPTSWKAQYLNGGHECLVVRISHPVQDPLSNPAWDARQNRHIGQRNIHVMTAAEAAATPANVRAMTAAAATVPPTIGINVGPLYGAPATINVARADTSTMPWLHLVTMSRTQIPTTASPTGDVGITGSVDNGTGLPNLGAINNPRGVGLIANETQVNGDAKQVGFVATDGKPAAGSGYVYRVTGSQGGETFGVSSGQPGADDGSTATPQGVTLPDRLTPIKTQLGQLMPGVPISQFTYRRQTIDRFLSFDGYGKATVVYSNNQKEDPNTFEPIGPPQQAIWQCWMQGKLMGSDQWDALPGQTGSYPANQKRHAGSLCSSPTTSSGTPTSVPPTTPISSTSVPPSSSIPSTVTITPTPSGSSSPPLSNLPTLTTAQSTPNGETCVSTATSTQCALGPNPSETACVTNTYCASFAPTAVTTSLTAAPTPTGQVYIDIYTDSDCIKVLEQTILNVIGQCYSPTDSKGNPVTFACFALTYISTAASNSADLIAYKGGGCFAQFDTDSQTYPNLTSIQYQNEKPFTLGSLGLGSAGK